MKNAIIGQSGGPTAAINATLSGVVRELAKSDKVDTIYGMLNGIEGCMQEKFCNLSKLLFTENDFVRLEKTPSAALGSCRLKLPAETSDKPEDVETYTKLFEILNRYNIGYFFYIGGNDSMDTIRKLSSYGDKIGSDIRFVGIPKTIDNDLACTDHTPGYGSAAKYVAASVAEILCDTAVYKLKAVTVVEIMGRDAGWLTAAAALSKPDLVYLPEVPFSVDEFIEDLREILDRKPNVVVAVSEGIRDKNGRYISESEDNVKTDSFGHKQLSGTGRVLEAIIKEKIGCKARTVEFSILQRCAAHIASAADIEESIKIGSFGARLALEGESGCMATFVRTSTKPYSCTCQKAELNSVANVVRQVPREFINERGNHVTSECIEWIRPLVLGESIPEFENGLPVQFII
ncbi:MAG: 6-phosphofructokinase [Clostridia bacterium]|nr:6-phosphofructokinase [Clostridia bacterium]